MRGKGRKKDRTSLSNATEAVHKFKYELAEELGEIPRYYTDYWGNVATRELENPSGEGIRQMMSKAEEELQSREGGFR